jgi:hypothetical protein
VGIPFKEFKSVTAKLRHAFTCIPAGIGLLSPCNRVLKVQPHHVYLHKNLRVLTAIEGCQSLLGESTKEPTSCRELICGWPNFVRIVDALSHGVGGVIFGELSACTPTVFQWQWPENIRTSVVSLKNPNGTITNSDLELAGLLMLWLAMEEVCGPLREKMRYAVQRQLANHWVGHTPRIETILGGRTPYPSPGTTIKNPTSLPTHPNSHRGKM